MTDPRRATHPGPPGLPDAAALEQTPHVVVVGAGIAGLAAATGLAERGVTVEIVEREPYLGGRVGGWTDDNAMAMNRGFHAFFRQYYNLRDLLRRIDPGLRMLTPVDDYPLVDAHGRRDTFRGLPQTPPLNALAFALRSPTFRLRDLARLNARAAAPLAAVSVPEIYRRLDHVDADTFLRDINFPDAARHLAFEVFSRSFFAEPTELSAAELATMFHIYFLGSSEGLIFDVANANFDVALWNPLRSYLESRGVRFHTGVGVTSVDPGPRFHVRCDSGAELDADGVVLATDVAACNRSSATLRASVTTAGGRGSPPCAPHRRSLCSGCGWTCRSTPAERLFSARAGARRWTMSVCWSATNGKPPAGRGGPAARSSSCTATRSPVLETACVSGCWPGCTSSTPRPLGPASSASACCAAATARGSRPATTPRGRPWPPHTPAWRWPATASASICRWR